MNCVAPVVTGCAVAHVRLVVDAGRQYENSDVSRVTASVAVVVMPNGSPSPPGTVLSKVATPFGSAVVVNVPRNWLPSPKLVASH